VKVAPNGVRKLLEGVSGERRYRQGKKQSGRLEGYYGPSKCMGIFVGRGGGKKLGGMEILWKGLQVIDREFVLRWVKNRRGGR